MTDTRLRHKRILLVGFGQLGKQLGQQLSLHNEVFALQRSLPSGQDGKVMRLQADLLDPHALDSILPAQLDYVVISLTPSSRDVAGYRAIFIDAVGHLLNALKKQQAIKRLLFVSSTSVYHQNDGSWVDESSPTEPTGYAGKILIEAEQALFHADVPVSIVRFSGIYGGQRSNLLKRVVQGQLRPSIPERLSNRIHEQDCIGVLWHLLELEASGTDLAPVYLASDEQPVSLNTVIDFIREELDLPKLEPSTTAPAARRGGDKRCNNAQLKESGFAFAYPSFKEGYREQIARHGQAIQAWLSET